MASTFRTALLAWYDRHARDLPWRHTRDPWAIWVSEVMLQQTRVETVRRYYDAFLARFPTPAALAAADEDAVLSAWSGLGYYRRARLLQRGAREVCARHGGRVPEDAAARRALPGVGRYTAGAIGSIAFDRPEPIVDGNVARVLARQHGLDTPLGRADTERALWAHAEAVVAGPRPGALNQALMELGATVCTPVEPGCGRCPVADGCAARREGRTDALPVPRPRRPPTPVALVAAVARDEAGRVWLLRQEGALFGGLWSPPTAPLPSAQAADPAAAVPGLLAAAGLGDAGAVRHVGRVEHVLTHRRLVVEVCRCAPVRGRVSDALRAVPWPAEGPPPVGLGLSRLAVRLVERAADGSGAVPPTGAPAGQLRLLP